MSELLDSFSLGLTNSLGSINGVAWAETFFLNKEATIESYSRYLYRNGTRTGDLTARIYNIVGTYGVDATPDYKELVNSTIDSYSESNKTFNTNLHSETAIYGGQSFTVSNENILDSVKFFLIRGIGNATGSAYAMIYAHNGTYGTSSVPTGSALATSDALDVTTISKVAYELKTFTFSRGNQIVLKPGVKYCVVLNYSGGDGSNQINPGIRADGSQSHSGNAFVSFNGTAWFPNNSDWIFYVYGKKTKSLAISDSIECNTINSSIPGPYTTFTFSGANIKKLPAGYYYMTVESTTEDYMFNTNCPIDQSTAVGDSSYLDTNDYTWTRDTPGIAFGVYGTKSSSSNFLGLM